MEVIVVSKKYRNVKKGRKVSINRVKVQINSKVSEINSKIQKSYRNG